MSIITKSFLVFLFAFLITGHSYAGPKVTQAALVDFKVNRSITVLAVEEFGKAPSLIMIQQKEKIFSIQFDDFFKSVEEFAYTNSFLRFRRFDIRGLSSPILLAVAAFPGGSDEAFQVKIIGERDGKITLLNPEPLLLTIQDGIFLGRINNKYGYGMITWKYQDDAAHYARHRYEIIIQKWDPKSMKFVTATKLMTAKKFKDGPTALKHHGLPFKNLRDDVTRAEEDIGTLGAEGLLMQSETTDK